MSFTWDQLRRLRQLHKQRVSEGNPVQTRKSSKGSAKKNPRGGQQRKRPVVVSCDEHLKSIRQTAEKSWRSAEAVESEDSFVWSLHPPMITDGSAQPLTGRQALLHYRARLHTLPADQWAQLDGKWISVYSQYLLNRAQEEQMSRVGGFSRQLIESPPWSEDPYFPGWLRVLFQVASRKSVQLKGVLPHNFRREADRGIRYHVAPHILRPEDRAPASLAASSSRGSGEPPSERTRHYLGIERAHLGLQSSVFAFTRADSISDALWLALLAEGHS